MAIENGLAVFSLRLPRELAEQIDKLTQINKRNRNGQIVFMLEQMIDLQVNKDRKILAETASKS